MKDIGKSSLNNSWGMLQRLMFTVLFAVFAIGAFAQNKVTGTVVDVQGEPIIGASVVVKGTAMVPLPISTVSSLLLTLPQKVTSLLVM